MSAVRIEDLFNLYRFQDQQEFHKVLLYFPFGFLLLLFRLAISLLAWPILSLLPRTSKIRSYVLKGVLLSYGIWIKYDGKYFDEKIKVIVANHMNVLDHMIIDAVKPCRVLNIQMQSSWWNCFTFFWGPEERNYGNVTSDSIGIIQKLVKDSDLAVLIFPEGAMTNGKIGLLKFNTWPFALNLSVQPVVIQVSALSFISISRSVIGTSAWYDFLWLLFVPYTVFTLRALPAVEKMENESVDEFSKRVQRVMASSLNLLPTVYTAKDKDEYRKRLQNSSTVHVQPVNSRENLNSSNPEINQMAKQIKEILPDVPFEVLLKDLAKTKCIDETVARILDGTVPYIPEQNFYTATASTSSSSDIAVPGPSNSFSSVSYTYSVASSEVKTKVLPSLNTSVSSFGKTPKERMLSYQERKSALIQAARLRYMQKHGML